MLKIKLMLSEKNYETVAKELTESGHQIDENADLLLTERQTYPDLLTARKDDRIYRLPMREVTYIESLGHDILAHRGGMEYRPSERLIRLQEMLNPKDFLRISNSVIVNVHCIQSIKPALSAKFILTLTDGAQVDVTRSYYYIFKDFFEI